MAPLYKRLPRDLKNNLGKYLGIFVLMSFAIAFTSGFLGAAASIVDICDGMRDKYNVEDFYLTTMDEMSEDDIAAVEDFDLTLYENFSRDVVMHVPDDDRDISLRVFRNRGEEFDQAAYAEGRAPETDHEIALDRVFCQNHHLSVGDTVEVEGEDYALSGIVTLVDYTVTYKAAGDFMFNAVTFTVAQVTDEAYEHIVGDAQTYTYVALLDDRDMALVDRTQLEEDIVDVLVDRDVKVTAIVDAESNIGLTFAPEDVEGDSTMWTVLLLILVAVMAFVFVVLTDATIEQESSVIGTLLASGYRKRELIRHYLVLPAIIGLLGIAVGNAFGNTLLVNPMKNAYYGSYGLPPFVHTWHWDVFIKTSAVPFALLMIITLLGLVRKLGATPLQFLRHEAGGRARRKGLTLPEGLPYASRFRLRVFMRNASHFATLLVGIVFGSILLLMGLCLIDIVRYNAELMADDVPAEHIYLLKAELQIDGTEEERRAWAAAWELETDPGYNPVDLDLLEDIADDLEGMGIDLDELAEDGDSDGASELISLPPQIEDAIEESIDHEIDPADPQINATFRMLAAAMDIDLASVTDDQITQLIDDADTFHRQIHRMDDEHMENFFDLLDDLMAYDGELENPVNQTPIPATTLDQTERLAMASFSVPRRLGEKSEEITIYGIEEGSRYWSDIDVSGGRIILGAGIPEKCLVEVGEPFELLDRFTNDTYTITGVDTCGNPTSMSVYMSLDTFNELFGNEEGYFNGHASDEELPLDERYVAAEITPDKMLSMAEQMDSSMSGIMRMITWMVVPIYLVLIYLLTKTVIDRSTRAISYMKVFGYHDREIDGLYVRAITVTVVLTLIISIPIVQLAFAYLVPVLLADYSGNFALWYPVDRLVEIVAIGIATYAVVAVIHVARIRKVSLALAMKVQE